MSRHHFNSEAAAPTQATTTVRELLQEFTSYSKTLADARIALQQELQGISRDKQALREEFDDTADSFVKLTLPELQTPLFDRIADLAQNTPSLPGQGLAFYRKRMLDQREETIAGLRTSHPDIADADGFRTALEAAQANVSQTEQAYQQASGRQRGPEQELAAWKRENPVAVKFLELSDRIGREGGRPINEENRGYYDPGTVPVVALFKAAVQYVSRDGNYRAVRQAMVAYDHGDKGRDVFADLGGWKRKTDGFKEQSRAEQATVSAAEQAMISANTALEPLAAAAPSLMTDEQILGKVHKRVTEYLGTPAFRKAMADEFAEDFPTSLELTQAKIAALGKLEEGVHQKLEALQDNLNNISTQVARLTKASARSEVNVDIEALRAQNRARTEAYNGYLDATREGRARTASYDPPREVVYVDNGNPDFLTQMIIWDMMRSHEHHESRYEAPAAGVPSYPSADSTSNSRWGGDLLGGNNSAVATSEPDFDFIRTPTAIDQQVDRAFDFIREEPVRTESYGGGYSSRPVVADSPSFGGGGGSSRS